MLWQQYVRKGKSEEFKSKIEMQKYAIDRCVEGGLKFSTVVMDSWYFDNSLVKFIESKGKYWIAEIKDKQVSFFKTING